MSSAKKSTEEVKRKLVETYQDAGPEQRRTMSRALNWVLQGRDRKRQSS